MSVKTCNPRIAKILESLPATATEIEEKTGFSRDSVRAALLHLEVEWKLVKKGRKHIGALKATRYGGRAIVWYRTKQTVYLDKWQGRNVVERIRLYSDEQEVK